MRIRTETYTLPAHWASYLINGDGSGMESAEVAEVDSWLAARPELGSCVDCGEEEFTTHGDDGNLGGDRAKFTFPLLPGLRTLQRAAQKVTAKSGHRMRWTAHPAGTETVRYPFANGQCRDCGKGVEIYQGMTTGEAARLAAGNDCPKSPGRFHTRTGNLTTYALACGYVEKFGEFVSLSLDSPGSGCFHVKRHPSHPAGWKWETAQNVTDARKLARRLAREVAP